MKKLTLEKILRSSRLSVVEKSAVNCLLETRKANGHRDLKKAAAQLRNYHPELCWDDRLEIVTDVAKMADDIEW